MPHSSRWIGPMLALVFALSGCRALARPAPASTPGASSIRAFVEPENDHQVVLDTLKEAQASIWMEAYLLNDREIMDALKTAQARGVAVRIILEAQPVGGGTGNKPAIAELRGANLDIRTGNPAYKLTHGKIILVDGRLALVMTLDQTRADFVANREYGIVDTDPGDIAEMQAVLEADWKRVAPTTSNQNLVWSPGDARRKLVEFIDGAKTMLDIQAVEMRDEEIQAHLLARAKSGTAVRVIMSPPPNGPDVNAPALNQLIRGGAQVRMLKIPYIHATMMVADRARAYVGSHSFSPLSIDSSRELGILVTEQKAVERLQGTFMNDWEIGKQREAR
jgi:cardiolipin synthase